MIPKTLEEVYIVPKSALRGPEKIHIMTAEHILAPLQISPITTDSENIVFRADLTEEVYWVESVIPTRKEGKKVILDQSLSKKEVKKGGCAGLQYEMEVQSKAEGDIVAGDEQARVFVAQEAVEYLEGMTLDYSISLSDSGFKIINPNAARACGCGTSFEAKKETNTENLEEGEACESELAENA